MPNHGYAFFVQHPRCIDDLMRPHLLEAEREYTVVGRVRLNKIDFDNFLADMLADRWFIEKYASLCKETDPLHCLFTYCNTCGEAVLILPASDGHVKYAACIPYSPK